MNDNAKNPEHPDQDPAEGSRDIVERELKRQDNQAGQTPTVGRPADRPKGGSPQN